MNIPVYRPDLTSLERKYLLEAFDSGWISSQGQFIDRFETEFAKRLGIKHAIAVSNGTVALHLALLGAGIGPGDEVLVPNFTFVATANAVAYCDATPVLCDVQRSDWNIDVFDAERKITAKTKAIIPCHIYGIPCAMNSILSLAKYYHLKVVEDAAEALGAQYFSTPIGKFGEVSSFSLFGNKNITCFPAGTTILVKSSGRGKSSIRKIEEIKVGQEVLSYNVATSQKEYKKVLATQQHSISESLKIINFSNGNRIKLTKDHPIFIVSKGWVKAEDICIGDKAIQYIYRGLKNIEARGKTTEEQFGQDVAKRKAEKQAISLAKAHKEGRFNTPKYMESIKRVGARNKGRKASDVTREAMSVGQKQRYIDNPSLKETVTLKLREWGKKPENIQLRRERMLNLKPEYRKKISVGVKRAMQKDSYWQAYYKGLNVKKNRAEAKLESILNEVVVGEFVFNGDYSQKCRIGRYTPDFIHTGDKKKIIELFGARWHTQEELEKKQAFYKEHGYESLFIWDYEITSLEKIESVKQRILNFTFNPNTKIVEVSSIEEEDFEGTVYNITVEENNNYFTKGILVHNCGEGGVVVTDNDEIAKKIRCLKGQGQTERYWHPIIGYNYRLTNLQAAIACAQLERLDIILDKKVKIWNWYNQYLPKRAERQWYNRHNVDEAYWMMAVYHPEAQDIVKRLASAGVDTRPGFNPLSIMPPFKNGTMTGTWLVQNYKNIFVLPSYPELTEEQVKYICDVMQ